MRRKCAILYVTNLVLLTLFLLCAARLSLYGQVLIE